MRRVLFVLVSCCVAAVAVMVKIAWPHEPELCLGAKLTHERMQRSGIDASKAQIRQLARACEAGRFARVTPTPTPEPYAGRPGCQSRTFRPARPLAPRTAPPPTRRIPYFAARSGVLPADGRPTVGGVKLPQGSRCVRYWATDQPVEDAPPLARRLADTFPQTGLWPILWDDWEDVDTADLFPGDPRQADRVDVERLMRRQWPLWFGRHPYVGLSASSRPMAKTELYSWVPRGRPVRAVMLLIPANRPADVLVTADFVATEYYSGAQLAAVARRWEERFGAVVTSLAFGGATFSVGAPPRRQQEAIGLAAEQIMIAPDNVDTDVLDALKRHLKRGSPFESPLPRQPGWEFGWPD